MGRKIKIGVLGAYRGTSMINYCKIAGNAEVVAICDKWKEGLERQKQANEGLDITYYDNFDNFIEHDMDAVVLANYANEHAPFAIRALKKGKHVFSEVLPCQNMKEAVELVEAVEESGLVYAYGENYCYIPGPYEMKRQYEQGKIGEIEYAECEYVHNCESIWPSIAYGDKDHWRNNMYSTFYCTHSLGPIIHITGLRPVSVVGIEGPIGERVMRIGKKGGIFGMEIVKLENGATVKSLHGGLYTHSVWYSMYGGKGSMETSRESEDNGASTRINIISDEYSGAYTLKRETYLPKVGEGNSEHFGHGGSDFYSMYFFVEKLLGNKDADIIDVYEALDMCLPGHFAFRSILNGNVPMEIPNLRTKEERDKWRNDVACTDVKVAGKDVWPTHGTGTPVYDDEVYKYQRKKFLEDLNSDSGYSNMAFKQGSGKK